MDVSGGQHGNESRGGAPGKGRGGEENSLSDCCRPPSGRSERWGPGLLCCCLPSPASTPTFPSGEMPHPTRRSSNALFIRRQDNGVKLTLFCALFQWDFIFLTLVMLRKGLPFVWFEYIFFLFRNSSSKVLTNSQVNYQGVQ